MLADPVPSAAHLGMPHREKLRRGVVFLVACAGLYGAMFEPAAAQTIPRVSVGEEEVPAVLIRREALRLFAPAVMEDLGLRCVLEQKCQVLADGGLAVPALSIDDPIATEAWIDQLFLPAEEKDFPPLDKLGCADTQLGYIQGQLRQRYLRLAAGAPEVKPISDLERSTVRGIVQRYALRDASERWAWCELPDDVALCAGGISMQVGEAWERCFGGLAAAAASGSSGEMVRAQGAADRAQGAVDCAATWAAYVTVLERELNVHGGAMTEAECREFLMGTLGRGSSRDASLEFQVLTGLGMPSNAAFATYAWLRESFARRWIHTLGRAEIEAALTEIEQELAQGSIDVDVLLFRAYDFLNALPDPRGREAARVRAAACAERMAGGASFDELFEEQSEFQDLRTRTLLLSGPDAFAKTNRGRFKDASPARLNLVLGSTPFDLMTGGVDLARVVAHELPIGVVSGPLECTFGVCFVRVNQRRLASPPLDLNRASDLWLARETLLNVRFERWIVERVAQAGIAFR